jgi:hypothetical protein
MWKADNDDDDDLHYRLYHLDFAMFFEDFVHGVPKISFQQARHARYASYIETVKVTR